MNFFSLCMTHIYGKMKENEDKLIIHKFITQSALVFFFFQKWQRINEGNMN